jgi:Tfp pilus assembly protein PilX
MKQTTFKTQRCGTNTQTTANRRSGVALLVVLVAIGIVSSIGMTLLRMSLMHHRQAQRSAFASQSRLLAESAFDQTGRRLKSDAKLAGFTWSVPAAELDGRHAAQVTIEVKPVENAPQRRVVTVIADYPAAASQRVRTRCVRLVDL